MSNEMKPPNARVAHRLARMLIEMALAQAKDLEVSGKLKATTRLTDCQDTQKRGSGHTAGSKGAQE